MKTVFALAIVLCASCGGGARPTPCLTSPPVLVAHYVDEDGNTLENYDAVWTQLASFFHASKPRTIRVRMRASGTSMFDLPSRTIVISLASISPSEGRTIRTTIAHESSHLFLAELTGGASTLDEFRFVDEGLATILEHAIGGTPAELEAHAMRLAAARMSESAISLDRVQKWPTFFGTPDKGLDFGAYDVGVSFVLFVRHEVGEARLLEFLRAIGETRSLDAALTRIFSRSRAEVEAAWIAFVRKTKFETPKIVEQHPKEGEKAVPISLQEIAVTFDADMAKTICLQTACKEGICFDHARWRTERTLAIEIDAPLLPKHAYRIGLGAPSCRLRTRTGDELPLVDWHFETE